VLVAVHYLCRKRHIEESELNLNGLEPKTFGSEAHYPTHKSWGMFSFASEIAGCIDKM
jgi:hypothetical protein